MTATITLDKGGRVVIPKPLRDELRLAPGDAFELESEGEEIILRPIREESRMFKKRGIWVFQTGKPLSAEETDSVLQVIRQERDGQNLGDA